MEINNITVKKVNEGGEISLRFQVTDIDLERPDPESDRYRCCFYIDFEDDGEVEVTIRAPRGESMPLDKQWKKIIAEAKARLKEAADSLPSDDISEHIDLGRGGARST